MRACRPGDVDVDALGLVVQGPGQPLLDAHRSTSSDSAAPTTSSPREICDFTVPSRTPITSAIAASGRSIQKRSIALASPIGLVMALVPEPLYDFYVQGPGLWGLDPLADQQIAGVTMSLTETVVFFAVFAVYFGRFFAEQDAVT